MHIKGGQRSIYWRLSQVALSATEQSSLERPGGRKGKLAAGHNLAVDGKEAATPPAKDWGAHRKPQDLGKQQGLGEHLTFAGTPPVHTLTSDLA